MKYNNIQFTPPTSKKVWTPLGMPKKGQFVIIWKYDNKIWSNTFRWKENKLQRYHEESDRWSPYNDAGLTFLEDLHYIIYTAI